MKMEEAPEPERPKIPNPSPTEVELALMGIEKATLMDRKESPINPLKFWQEGSLETEKDSEKLRDDVEISNNSSFGIYNLILSRILVDVKREMKLNYYYKKYAPTLDDLRSVYLIKVKDDNVDGLNFEVYANKRNIFKKRKELIIFKITSAGKIVLP